MTQLPGVAAPSRVDGAVANPFENGGKRGRSLAGSAGRGARFAKLSLASRSYVLAERAEGVARGGRSPVLGQLDGKLQVGEDASAFAGSTRSDKTSKGTGGEHRDRHSQRGPLGARPECAGHGSRMTPEAVSPQDVAQAATGQAHRNTPSQNRGGQSYLMPKK